MGSILYDSEDLSDFVITHQDKYIRCHKPLLYGIGLFRNIFKYDPKQSALDIENEAEFEIVELMVKIAYGKFDYVNEFLSVETLAELFAGCEIYMYEYGLQIATYQIFERLAAVEAEFKRSYPTNFRDLLRFEYWSDYRAQYSDLYNNQTLSDALSDNLFVHQALVYGQNNLNQAYGIGVIKVPTVAYLIQINQFPERTRFILDTIKVFGQSNLSDELIYITQIAKFNKIESVLEVLLQCSNNPVVNFSLITDVLDIYYDTQKDRLKATKVVQDTFAIPNCERWDLIEIIFYDDTIEVDEPLTDFINRYYNQIKYLLFEHNDRQVKIDLHMFDVYLPEEETQSSNEQEQEDDFVAEQSEDDSDNFELMI